MYHEVQVRNAMRQLHNEYTVGQFIGANKGNYDAVVALGSDIWLPPLAKLSPLDIADVIADGRLVLTSENNNGHGYTNGFYVGSLEAVAKIMSRYKDASVIFPEEKDYEHQLKRSFEMHKLSTRPLTNFAKKLQSFAKLRFSAEHWPKLGIDLGDGEGPRGVALDPPTVVCLTQSPKMASRTSRGEINFNDSYSVLNAGLKEVRATQFSP
jgi:hypothetical protein